VHRIALYDLDRTITRRPTWSMFLLFGAGQRSPGRLLLLPAVAAAALAATAGLVSRDRLKELMHRIMLGRAVPRAEMAVLADLFARRTADRNIRPAALARIAADRRAGFRIVLATAAHRFYAEAVARRLGIGDVIATEAAGGPGGTVLSELQGANVYGRAKLAAVEAWLAAEGIARDAAHLRFYSDHASDRPCLAFADEGFAVNPHRRLRRMARAQGWPVLDWQRPPAPGGA